jgi:hypothetical protein
VSWLDTCPVRLSPNLNVAINFTDRKLLQTFVQKYRPVSRFFNVAINRLSPNFLGYPGHCYQPIYSLGYLYFCWQPNSCAKLFSVLLPTHLHYLVKSRLSMALLPTHLQFGLFALLLATQFLCQAV